MHWLDIISNCYGKKWDIIIDFRSSLLSYFLKHKQKFILVGSKSEEENYLNAITKNVDSNKIINLFGASLTQTAAYLKKSKLFIGNDSGLSHMASATKLKSIVLFGPTNDIIYGPFMQDSQVIRTNESYDYFKSINIDKTKSYMDSISVEKIYFTLQKNNYCE